MTEQPRASNEKKDNDKLRKDSNKLYIAQKQRRKPKNAPSFVWNAR